MHADLSKCPEQTVNNQNVTCLFGDLSEDLETEWWHHVVIELLFDDIQPITVQEAFIFDDIQPITVQEAFMFGDIQPITVEEAFIFGDIQPITVQKAFIFDDIQPITMLEAFIFDDIQPITVQEAKSITCAYRCKYYIQARQLYVHISFCLKVIRS